MPLLLVRDIRHALVSHYEKWHADYRLDFHDYLRGVIPPHKRRLRSDIWRKMEFCNACGQLAAAGAVETRVSRYEEMLRDPAGAVAAACDWFRIPATPETIARAVAMATKDEMARRSRPQDPHETVVRRDPRHPFAWFTEADRAFVQNTCRKYLRHSFGYDYQDWSGADTPAARPPTAPP